MCSLDVATHSGDISAVKAFFAEFVGTFILMCTVFGVIHRKAPAPTPTNTTA